MILMSQEVVSGDASVSTGLIVILVEPLLTVIIIFLNKNFRKLLSDGVSAL